MNSNPEKQTRTWLDQLKNCAKDLYLIIQMGLLVSAKMLNRGEMGKKRDFLATVPVVTASPMTLA